MDLSSYSIRALTRRRPLTPIHHHHHHEARQQVDTLAQLDEETKNAGNKLKRTLTLIDIICYGVGCSVGAGIYSLVGIGAQEAGPAIALSFLICGVSCCFTSLSYAEFAARVPLAGSAYTFTYVSFGELAGWLVGWNLTLGYAISAAVVARSWAEYGVVFVHGLTSANDAVSSNWTKFPLPWLGGDGYTCCPLSVIIVALCTLILVTGVKESTRFNTAMTLLNLTVLVVVLMSGVGHVDAANNLQPFFTHGIAGMAQGAGLVFFSYLGFDMVACLSEECKNPERNMPIGIIGSLLVSMTIYVSVSLVVVGMTPVSVLGTETPIVNALLANACCTPEQQRVDDAPGTCVDYALCDPVRSYFLYFASRLISFGAMFGLTTATFACLMGQPRINYAAAQDGLLFPIFAKVNPQTGVPTVGTVLTGVVTAMAACFVDLEVLANVISLGTLQVFAFVSAGVIVLRLRGPDLASASSTAPPDGNVHNHSIRDRGCEMMFPNETSRLVLGDCSNDDDDDNNNKSNSGSSKHCCLSFSDAARSLGLIKATSLEIRESMRSRDSQLTGQRTQSENASLPVWLVLLYAIACTVASLAWTNAWSLWWIYASIPLALGTAMLLFLQPKSAPPETFACPFVPAIPLLAILTLSYMMGSLPLSTWWAILGWLSCGLSFYLLYGIHHSHLRTKTLSHPTRTAPSLTDRT